MKNLLYIALIALPLTGIGQDFHLTQFDRANLYYNPATAGRSITPNLDYRASMVYRSQWGSISSKAFSTAYLGYDTHFKGRWGLGVHAINNQGGAPTFRTFSFMLSGSYDIIDDPQKEHVLTTGLQMGVMNHSFKSDGLTYDMQYSSDQGTFDPGAYSGEEFNSTSRYRFDAAWGIYYRYNGRSSDYTPFAGLSLGHISLPGQHFTSDKINLPMIWRFNAGTDYVINEEIEVRPEFLFMMQKKATELYLNAIGTYHFENEDYDINLLLGYRNKDAFMVGLGMRYKEFIGMMSYDFNTSYLKAYTAGRGGFEFSLIYEGKYKNEKAIAFFH